MTMTDKQEIEEKRDELEKIADYYYGLGREFSDEKKFGFSETEMFIFKCSYDEINDMNKNDFAIIAKILRYEKRIFRRSYLRDVKFEKQIPSLLDTASGSGI